MTRKPTTAALLCLLAIAPAARANLASDALAGMSEQARNSALGALLRHSGESCVRVTRSFYQGATASGDAFWDVSCGGGMDFVVLVHNNPTGSTNILSCAMLKAVGGGTCWKHF